MGFDYKKSYAEAKAELERLQNQKRELGDQMEQCDKQIAGLTQALRALAPLVGEEPPRAAETPSGMTDCIRAIVGQSCEPLTASEIRECLEGMGFDMKSYSNPLATIHTVLRRLEDSGEVESTHESVDAKKVTIPVSKHLAVEKIMGKDFQIGKMKGFIGVGRLRRRSHNDVQSNVQQEKR